MDPEFEEVEFHSGGVCCRAWFMAPPTGGQELPCVVVGHGLGLNRESGLLPFGRAFVRAGYCALVFDYRSFGDSDGAPRQVISFAGQVQDWEAAIDYARSRPEVRPDKVVAWGFSLGGGHAVRVASIDHTLAAAVAVAPMLSGLSSTLAAIRWWSPLTFLRIVGRGLADLFARVLGRSPVQVPLSAPPGNVGLLTSPDAYVGYQAIVPKHFNFGTAAAIALYFWTYRPGGRLGHARCPVLLIPSTEDRINPPGPTRRFAARGANIQTIELRCHHMEVAVEPHRSAVVDATVGFLADALSDP